MNEQIILGSDCHHPRRIQKVFILHGSNLWTWCCNFYTCELERNCKFKLAGVNLIGCKIVNSVYSAFWKKKINCLWFYKLSKILIEIQVTSDWGGINSTRYNSYIFLYFRVMTLMIKGGCFLVLFIYVLYYCYHKTP